MKPNPQRLLFEKFSVSGFVVCDKCSGCGWLWNYELDRHVIDIHDCSVDDTRYTCDKCEGECIIKLEK